MVLERADHLQARAITDVGEPRVPVATKVPLEDVPVIGAVEKCSPGLELANAAWRLLGVQLGHPPVVEVLAPAHRVGEVDSPVVSLVHGRKGCRDATLGHHGMRFPQQRFAHEPD